MKLYWKIWPEDRDRNRFRMGVLGRLNVAMVVFGLLVGWAEAGLSGKTEVEKVMGPRVIVLIGASYAGGWDPSSPIAGYQIVNKGVSGQQSFEMLARFESDVLALKPNAVIIWGFINDIFRSERSQIDQTVRRTQDSVRAMVNLAKKAHIVPILATEVTIRSKRSWSEPFQAMIGSMLGKSSYQDYINRHVLDTNRWIKEFAEQEKILVLDLEAVLSDQAHVRREEFASEDGSHISPAGYAALHSYVEESLKRWGGFAR
jgi:lysophospholipase L1-like esterase